MHNKVKLGIIGYGHIGSQHGRAIRDGKCPQVELTAVCDCDPARLELARKTNGQALNLYTEAKELIHSGTCEAVIIARSSSIVWTSTSVPIPCIKKLRT